jgi:proline racemase
VPEVSGSAFITGRHEFIVDPHDTLGRGFLLS